MATVTGFTAERMLAMEDATVVDGSVIGGSLILVTKGGTPIDAGPVQGPQGSVGIQGPPGTPGEKLTTGLLGDFPKAPVPAGWLLCDGSIRTIIPEEAALAAYLGTTFGGNGTTTYGLPNYKGRVRVMQDPGDTAFDTIGEIGGEKAHILTIAELATHNHADTLAAPAHTHPIPHTHSLPSVVTATSGIGDSAAGTKFNISSVTGGSSAPNSGAASATALTGGVSNNGSSTAHNNLQPYVVTVTAIKI